MHNTLNHLHFCAIRLYFVPGKEKRVLSVLETQKGSACSGNYMYYISLVTSGSSTHSCSFKHTLYVEIYSVGNVMQLQVLPCLQTVEEKIKDMNSHFSAS